MKLKYPVSKSHMAFMFAVEEMFEKWPKSVYMWTFTFEKYQPDWMAMRRWDDLKVKLCGTCFGSRHNCIAPLLQGLRVVEVHPGNNFHGLSHGLHFHCLFNQRVSVHMVRRIARKYDFGRIQARRVSQEEANYIGKYLTKGQPELTKGARRWGTINWPEACKVRDIKVESQFTRNVVKVQEAIKQSKMSPDIIHSIFVNTRIHGEYKDWPLDRYYYSNRSEEVLGPDAMSTQRQSQGHCDPTLKPLLLRSNKRTREQSMLRQAIIWKDKAMRIAENRQSFETGDWKSVLKERLQSAGGGKNFEPRVATGESPVSKQDKTLSYYDDNWDTKCLKPAGI